MKATPLHLSSCHYPLDLSPSSWGTLHDSSPEKENWPLLRERMDADGYLFLRGFFRREIVEAARMALLRRLHEAGLLGPNWQEGREEKGRKLSGFHPEEGRRCPEIQRVVFGPEIKAFYTAFLGGEIRHFDYIWTRTRAGGVGTQPHCDIVYMGRGTRELYTAWIPYGDVSFEIGGLMVMENSPQVAPRIAKYLQHDVDTYCENIPGRDGWKFQGALSTNPASLREKFGQRWLGAEYQMGDLLTFRMDTVHASLDNQTDVIRLSTDTRYQLASEPVDERWIGEDPVGHGPAGKKGLIC